MTTAQERIDAVTDSATARKKQIKKALVGNDALLQYVGAVAPKLDARGVVSVAYAQVANTPALRDCEVLSVVRAVAEAAKLGLTVDATLGHAYLVPFRARGVKVAQMIVGYRGFIHLGYLSGRVSRWHYGTLCERDDWEYVEGTAPVFHHSRPLDERGEIVGAFATAHLTMGGPPLIQVMGLEEIHARRARSASYRSNAEKSPWSTDFAAMAMKCPVREMGKTMPVPILQAAALGDEAREEGRRPADPDDLSDLMKGMGEEGAPKVVEDDDLAACTKCGSLHLDAGGKCPDCDPGQTREEN